MLGVGWVVMVVVGVSVNTEGFDIKDYLHISCAGAVCVGQEAMGKDIGDNGIFAGVEAQVGVKEVSGHLTVEDICRLVGRGEAGAAEHGTEGGVDGEVGAVEVAAGQVA